MGMNDRPRLAWDSMVLIDAIEGPPSPRWDEIRPMYEDAKNGKVKILISEISIAEACKIRALRDGTVTTDEAEKMIRGFLNHTYIVRRPADRPECEMAADLIRKHSLETCDAIIISTAVIHRALVLYTRDGKRRRQSQPSPLKCDGLIGTPPLPIKEPSAATYLQQTLFVKDET